MYKNYLTFANDILLRARERGVPPPTKILLEISALCGEYDSEVEDVTISLPLNLTEVEFNRIYNRSFSRIIKEIMSPPQFRCEGFDE